MKKTLYCIRHGTALHNINFPKIGRRAYTEFRDTPLVDFGHLESITLGQEWRDINKIELVVVSPLTRTLQTAQNIFNSKPHIPILAIDCIKEYPQSEETCNYRQMRSILQKQFPSVDFTNITEDEDTAFQEAKRADNIELELLHKRIDTFKKWIASRSENHIAVVSHSSFLGEMLFGKIGDENNELFHCYPYVYKLPINESAYA